MTSDLFSYKDYKHYLRAVLPTTGPERGIRSRLAKAVGCQTTFVSQVLNGEVDFSLEHSLAVSRFLKHSTDEEEYFMLLVHLERAGSMALKKHYLKKVAEIQKKRETIARRIQESSEVAEQDRLIYYSHWRYAAIHVLVSIPKYQSSPTRIAEALGLSLDETRQCLAFLRRIGMIVEKDGRFAIGGAQTHISKESPLFAKHHANWRIQSILSAENPTDEDLHYSSVASLSAADLRKIKALILELIEKSDELIAKSHEERLVCIAFDLFPIDRNASLGSSG